MSGRGQRAQNLQPRYYSPAPLLDRWWAVTRVALKVCGQSTLLLAELQDWNSSLRCHFAPSGGPSASDRTLEMNLQPLRNGMKRPHQIGLRWPTHQPFNSSLWGTPYIAHIEYNIFYVVHHMDHPRWKHRRRQWRYPCEGEMTSYTSDEEYMWKTSIKSNKVVVLQKQELKTPDGPIIQSD